MECVELIEGLAPGSSSLVTPANDPVIVIGRSFAAPRALVWRCYTEPQHLVQFWGPKGSTTPVCELDLQVGGAWKTVMRFTSGNEYGYNSAYLEITPPERLVWRDAPMDHKRGDTLPPAVMVTELTLTEADGITTISIVVRFTSLLARDAAVKQGFAQTVLEGSDKLDIYLANLRDVAALN